MIERGTKTVSLPLSKEIAEILGCNIEDLLDEPAQEVGKWRKNKQQSAYLWKQGHLLGLLKRLMKNKRLD